MKPTNQQERKTAFGKFLGIYLITILIPLLSSCLYFYVPNHITAEENEALKVTVKEQKKLLDRLNSFEKIIASIHKADQMYLSETNEMAKADILKQIREKEDQYNLLLNEVKLDSLQYSTVLSKNMSVSMAHSFDYFLTYRGLVSPLRQLVEQKGSCCSDVEKLIYDLTAAQNKIDLLQTLNATLTSNSPAKSASGGGGGGGGDPEKDREIARLTAGNQTYLDEIKKCKEELALYRKQLEQKNLEKPVSSNNAALEALKDQLEFERALHEELRGDITRQSAIDRRDIYRKALAKFENIANNSTREDIKAKAQKRTTEISNKLRDLSW